MKMEIGIIAGEVIQLLESSDRPMRILEVEILIDHPVMMVDMALGWLIRENYLRVVPIAGEKFLCLSNKQLALTCEKRSADEFDLPKGGSYGISTVEIQRNRVGSF